MHSVHNSLIVREQIIEFIKENGPSSPMEIEKNFLNVATRARIATQILMDEGILILDERLRLAISK
jgi:hypothetical protein